MWDSQQLLGALYIIQCIYICISLLQQFATHGSLPVLQSALCIVTDLLYTSQLANNLKGWGGLGYMSKRKDPYVRLEVETHLLLNIKSFLDKTKPLSGKLFKTVVGGEKKWGGVCWHGRPGSYSGCLKSPLVTDKWAGQLLL